MDPYLENPTKLHLEMPLYHSIDIQDEKINEHVYSLMSYSGTLDAYCIFCNKESIFDARNWYNSGEYSYRSWNNTVDYVAYQCTRDSTHKYRSYYLKNDNTTIIKIGQYPSTADFQIPQAEKYRYILGEEDYKEMTKGIGLKAHGVGIGSFVYLRRIFEKLIQQSYKKALKDGIVTEDVFKKSRMDERINILKSYLPSFLVENRSIYSILSNGIHNLSEEECLKYFDTVKLGIEQILDEKIIERERRLKAQAAKIELADIIQETERK